MYRKPDVIRTLVIIFAVGLLVTGITSYASSENVFQTLSLSDSAESRSPAQNPYSSRYSSNRLQ